MAKYKILVIEHCLKNNVVAKYGEVVEESQLTSPADELVEAGFIEEVSVEAEAEEKKASKPKK